MPDPQLRSFRLDGDATAEARGLAAATNLDRLISGELQLSDAPFEAADPLRALMDDPEAALTGWLPELREAVPTPLLSTERAILIADYDEVTGESPDMSGAILQAYAHTNIVTLNLPLHADASKPGLTADSARLPDYWRKILADWTPDVVKFRSDAGRAFGHFALDSNSEAAANMHYALLRNPIGLVPMLQQMRFLDLETGEEFPIEPERIHLAPPAELRVFFEPRGNSGRAIGESVSCSKFVWVQNENGILIRTVVIAPWPVE